VVVRQGESVTSLAVAEGGVRVETDKGIYRSAAVLGADGSTGTVRRRLGWEAGERQARLLEVLTPESPAGGAGPAGWRGVAVFDFTPMTAGVRGYYWDFPSLVDGRPVMNRGIFDSRTGRGTLPPDTSLKQLLAEGLKRRGRRLEDHTLEGHPIRWFDRRARVAAPRILLAGDAAGADPLLGEGISFALAHGRVAAAAAADAFARRDLAFASYPARLQADPVLAQLARRRRLADAVYQLRGRRSIAAVWAVLPWLVGALLRLRPGILPVDRVRLERVSGPEPVFQGG
jgi:flavin-dependent dehydrogenase